MPIIGPEKDVAAPDAGTNAQVMAWMMDAYSASVGFSVPSVVTGKPLAIGGSVGREEATGRGVAIVTQEFARRTGITLAGASVVVQGFGNVGYNVARILSEEYQCRIVAVSDASRGWYHAEGLDIAGLHAACSRPGTLPEKWEAQAINNAELLELPCDILIPAALESQITAQNADRIQAKYVVEAANGPTTPEAHLILRSKGIAVVPDILANAGGVTVSYFEWVQGRDEYFWSTDEVNARLERIMVNAANEVWTIGQREKVDWRMAANVAAVGRVAEAIRARGLYG
jgi:glutamate dehydrogenase/leucine dehydrogenase